MTARWNGRGASVLCLAELRGSIPTPTHSHTQNPGRVFGECFILRAISVALLLWLA